MSGQFGVEYHRARAAAELERAAKATDAKIAALHRELAELHLMSADEGEDCCGLVVPLASAAPGADAA